MAQSDLEQTLATLRERIGLHQGSRISEEATKTVLVNPLLRALSWDTEDLHQVYPEYSSATGRVDYALLIENSPRLLIEAKSLDSNLDDPRWATQLTVYAVTTGVRWVVLTNGDEYRIYNAYAEVPIAEKLFHTTRLSDQDPNATKVLSLLSRDAMLDSLLDTHWQLELEERQLQRVNQQVQTALHTLFDQDPPDASLVRLLRNRLNDLAPAAIRESLLRLQARFEFLQALETEQRVPTRSDPPVDDPPTLRHAELDTVVVPARENNFREVFLGEGRWYAVSIATEMQSRIKYIAAYRATPISAITHLAPVQSIVPWKDSGKSVINFSEPAQEIHSIKLGRGIPPASRRYTSKADLDSAKSLADLWGFNPKADLKQIIEAGILNPPLEVHTTYQRQFLSARIEHDGSLTFRSQRFQSLSGAGSAAKRAAGYTGQNPATQGWTFWKFTDNEGHDKPINALRQRFLKHQAS